MSGSTIGIKIADGSYYPILEEGFRGRKKLTLTTAKDGQTKVQIDLYRGDGGAADKAEYIGSLIIENIRSAAKGTADIELSLGLNEAGELSAEANDRSTGESQTFSMSLQTLAAEQTYEIPEFEVEPQTIKTEAAVGTEAAFKTEAAEERPLTGETYPVGETDRRREPLERKGPNVFLIVLFVILGLALIGVIGWFVYRAVTGSTLLAPPTTEAPAPQKPEAAVPEKPAAPAAAEKPGAPAAAQKPAAAEKPAAAAVAAQGQTETPAQAASQPAAADKAKGADGVTYRIKRGDTLWDIAATYYRNPWLYPKLAKANKIRNPDLIFAGTKITIPQE